MRHLDLTIEQGVVFEQVCADLEGEGYTVQAFVIPAVAVNAPHRRDRVWIVAHTQHERAGHQLVGRNEKRASGRVARPDTDVTYPEKERSEWDWSTRNGQPRPAHKTWNKNWLEVATRLCRVDDGVSRGMDRNPRLKGLGNAIVPQVAAEIMRAIKQCDE